MNATPSPVGRITSVDVVLVPVTAVTPAFTWRDGLPGSEQASVGAWLIVGTESGITGY